MNEQPILNITQISDLPEAGYSLDLKEGRYAAPEALYGKIALWALNENTVGEKIGNINVWLVTEENFKITAEYGNYIKQMKAKNIAIVNRAKARAHIIEVIYASSEQLNEEKKSKRSDEDNEFINYFNELIKRAIDANASDIHIEKRDNNARIRFRINGELENADQVSPAMATKLNSVIYGTLADKGTTGIQADPKKFQTASISMTVGKQRIKLRYQSLPAYTYLGGQDVVMRLLKVDVNQTVNKAVDLELLGYSKDQVKTLVSIIKRPVGALVISGTTGSGKSTTLQQLIMYVNRVRNYRIKIYSIEDPPEYFIPGITQLPVQTDESKEEGSSPFYTPLKATMRGDPDLIMIGEVRDDFTADGLKKETQSGHQIMTTTHTGSGLGIIDRLEDFKIDRSAMGSNDFLTGLVYQKLVPQLCPKCSYTFKELFIKSDADETIMDMAGRLKKIGVNIDEDNIRVRNEKGCQGTDKHPQCRNGIIKRTVCAEVIDPDYTLYKFFREGKKIEAYMYWRSLSDGNLKSERSRGKTAMEHAIYKMFNGEVSPFHIEDLFGPIDEHNRLMEELKKDKEREKHPELSFLNEI
jgi:type II secretory ATPase GspE/PulE/Tfp pilus assembly ATPase PilB-like protein